MKTLFTILLATAATIFSMNAQSALLDSVVVTDLETDMVSSVSKYSYGSNGKLSMSNTDFAEVGYQGDQFNQSFFTSADGVLDSAILSSLGGYYGDLDATYTLEYMEDSITVVNTYPPGSEYDNFVEQLDLAFNEPGDLTYVQRRFFLDGMVSYIEQQFYHYGDDLLIDSIVIFAAGEGVIEDLAKATVLTYTHLEGKISTIRNFDVSFENQRYRLDQVDSFANYVGDFYTYKKTNFLFFSDLNASVDSIVLDENGFPLEEFIFSFDGNGTPDGTIKTDYKTVKLDWNETALTPVMELYFYLSPYEHVTFVPNNDELPVSDGFALESRVVSTLDLDTGEYTPIEKEEFFYNQPSSVHTLAKQEEIEVFPNPTTERLIFKNLEVENNAYRVFDTEGRLVQAGRLVSGSVNVSALSSGNYTITFAQNTQGKSYHSRFIKI